MFMILIYYIFFDIHKGSQVCNLMWSKNVNEIVSTHGYSLNQVIVWKYPSMQKIATLTGHTLRVLYLGIICIYIILIAINKRPMITILLYI